MSGQRTVRAALWLLLVGACTAVPLAAQQAAQYTDTMEFSDLHWQVRSSRRPSGPGPNRFAADGVQLEDGDLALRILQQGRRGWTSAEIRSAEPVGYGDYTAVIRLPESGLPRPLIFGFFTYDQNPACNHREIDIEFGAFGDPDPDAPQLHFSLQPSSDSERTMAVLPDPPGGRWELRLRYRPDGIDFSAASADQARPYAFHIAPGDVPAPGNMHLHLNLWLFRGQTPDRDHFLLHPEAYAVFIEKIEYDPYSLPNEN